eukprot:g4238.t1
MSVTLDSAQPSVVFNTNTKSRKFRQMEANSSVSLCYFDPAGIGYVNIIGTVERLAPTEALQHWEARQTMFYPEGHADGKGRFAVFRLSPTRLEMISMRLNIDSAGQDDWRPNMNTAARVLAVVIGSLWLQIAEPHLYLPNTVDRAKRDVAAGVFGKHQDENGNFLKSIDVLHKTTKWKFMNPDVAATRRVAEAGVTLENEQQSHRHWRLVKVNDAMQRLHDGEEYRLKVRVTTCKLLRLNCFTGDADVHLLWRAWAKPARELLNFTVSRITGHGLPHLHMFQHPQTPAPTPAIRRRRAAHPRIGPLGELARGQYSGTEASRRGKSSALVSRAREIVQLQNILRRYAKYKETPKFKNVELQLERLCQKDTLGTCRLFGDYVCQLPAQDADEKRLGMQWPPNIFMQNTTGESAEMQICANTIMVKCRRRGFLPAAEDEEMEDGEIKEEDEEEAAEPAIPQFEQFTNPKEAVIIELHLEITEEEEEGPKGTAKATRQDLLDNHLSMEQLKEIATCAKIPRAKGCKEEVTARFKIMEALGDGKILLAPKERKAEAEPETET